MSGQFPTYRYLMHFFEVPGEWALELIVEDSN